MAYEFLEGKAKKEKKGGAYSFLEGIEEVEKEEFARPLARKKPEAGAKTPAGQAQEKSDGEGAASAEKKDAVALDLFASAKPSVEEPASAEAPPKMGGILGKVFSGELKPAAEHRPGLLEGLSGLEKAAERGKKITGEVLEEGKGYRIIKSKEEKTLTYLVSMPEFSKEDKKQLHTIEKRAIGEIDVDPEAMLNYAEKKKVFTEKVLELITENYPDVKGTKKTWFATLIVQDMIGYGILDPLLSDDALEEVMLVATNVPVYVYHRKYGMCKTNIVFENDEEAIKIIARIARAVGRRVDASTPLLDARLKDGSRVNATVPPVSIAGPSLTIRKFKADPLTVVDIIKFGTMSLDLAAFLWLAMDGYEVRPANVLVSGGTGSGKTTTLNCLGSFIPSTSRVISIEDTAELQLPVKHWIRLETRPPNIEGKGEISMEMLLRNTLRMRPDRIIVGEVRGKEANTLLTAMNTGQSGSMGTLHANNSKETISRLVNKPMSVPIIMISALNLILMQNRFNYRGKTVRRITEITEILGVENGQAKLSNIFEWDPKTDTVKPTGAPSKVKRTLADLRGVDLKAIDREIERRKKVLKWMVDQNIHGVKEVGRLVNEYYIDPEGFLERISSGKGKEKAEPEEGKKAVKARSKRGIVDLFAEDVKDTTKEIIEKTEIAEIVRVRDEKNPVYNVAMPTFSKDDKELLRDIETKVVEKLDIDPSTMKNKEEAEKVFTEKVLEFIRSNYSFIGPAKARNFTRYVVYNLVGYGILEPLLKDEKLEEVMVIGTGRNVYVSHSEYGICRTNLVFEEDEEVERILERIAASVGRRIDKATPLLDARLMDGSRVNATIPPISIDGPTLTIRKFKADPLTVVDLINFKTLTTDIAAYLWYVTEGAGIKPGNILVAGGSGSGKTTTLNCLCSFIPDTERIITIEDTAELQLPATHWVRLETKPPNVEGEGEVDMDDLVKNTLRMRPDRVIVGEVRGPEARTLFTAMNTGHDGSMGTLHANSARETITRLTNPPMAVPYIMLPALDLIIMENKIYFQGTTLRRITEIAEVTEGTGEGEDTVTLNIVYRWNPKKDELEATGVPSVLKQKLARIQGIDVKEVNEEIEKRKKVLDYMVKKNINKIADVGSIISRYYSDTGGLLKEIGGKKGG
ncbi:MAG: CpaF family protein [Methanobacteriota archaeon]|nr:MAG: CpaF family protein [Euryarchaeota archaeon]